MENRMMRYNNFNILRLIAAFMVFSGHMGILSGSTIPTLWGQSVHSLGVKIFFLIGGYLITQSWIRAPNFLKFIIKRIIRIFPLLIVYVILITFIIGPLITVLSLKEYILHPGTLNYLKNIFLYPVYSLPGVFLSNPYTDAVNGSLWVLPVEFLMYILVPSIFTALGNLTTVKKLVLIGITFLACITQVLHIGFFTNWSLVIYGTDLAQGLILIPYFLIGMLYASLHINNYLNMQLAFVIILIYSSLNLDIIANEAIFFIVFPYFIFSFALPKRAYFWKFGKKYEFSYGFFIYGYFVQQLVVSAFIKYFNGYHPKFAVYLGVSIVITSLCAFVSYKLVEEKIFKTCYKFIAKLDGVDKNNVM